MEAKVWELLESGVSVQEAARLTADVKTQRRYALKGAREKWKDSEEKGISSAEFEIKKRFQGKWLQIVRKIQIKA